jgi:hypothetical protein
MSVERTILSYVTGGDLMTDDPITGNKTIPSVGTLGCGFLQLHHAVTKEQKLEGLQTVEAGIKEYDSVFRDYSDVCFGAFMLVALGKSEEYDRGIQHANDLLNKLNTNGIEGFYGRPELIRLKVSNKSNYYL